MPSQKDGHGHTHDEQGKPKKVVLPTNRLVVLVAKEGVFFFPRSDDNGCWGVLQRMCDSKEK